VTTGAIYSFEVVGGGLGGGGGVYGETGLGRREEERRIWIGRLEPAAVVNRNHLAWTARTAVLA
jgi:hypothetical protein